MDSVPLIGTFVGGHPSSRILFPDDPFACHGRSKSAFADPKMWSKWFWNSVHAMSHR